MLEKTGCVSCQGETLTDSPLSRYASAFFAMNTCCAFTLACPTSGTPPKHASSFIPGLCKKHKLILILTGVRHIKKAYLLGWKQTGEIPSKAREE